MKAYWIRTWKGLRRFCASYPQLGMVVTNGYILMDTNLRVKAPLPIREYQADERPIKIFSGEIVPGRALICSFRYLMVYGGGEEPLLAVRQLGQRTEADIFELLKDLNHGDIRYIAMIRDRDFRKRGLLREDSEGVHVRCPFEIVIIRPGHDGTFSSLLGTPSK